MKKIGCGGLLVASGMFMLLGLAVSLAEEGMATFDIGDMVGFLVMVAAPVTAGSLMIRSHFKHKQKALQAQQKALKRDREREILQLAQRKGGRLTITEIAADTSMLTDEAEKFMNELVSKGYVSMNVTDSGVIVYDFYDISHRGSLEE